MDALSVGTSRTRMCYQWTLTVHEWVMCGLSMGLSEHQQIIDGFKVGINTAWMGHQLGMHYQLVLVEHGWDISGL